MLYAALYPREVAGGDVADEDMEEEDMEDEEEFVSQDMAWGWYCVLIAGICNLCNGLGSIIAMACAKTRSPPTRPKTGLKAARAKGLTPLQAARPQRYEVPPGAVTRTNPWQGVDRTSHTPTLTSDSEYRPPVGVKRLAQYDYRQSPRGYMSPVSPDSGASVTWGKSDSDSDSKPFLSQYVGYDARHSHYLRQYAASPSTWSSSGKASLSYTDSDLTSPKPPPLPPRTQYDTGRTIDTGNPSRTPDTQYNTATANGRQYSLERTLNIGPQGGVSGVPHLAGAGALDTSQDSEGRSSDDRSSDDRSSDDRSSDISYSSEN